MNLIEFIKDSNRIEGITREPTEKEIQAHEEFLNEKTLTLHSVRQFVTDVANASLRNRVGMDVIVGKHRPPLGGEFVEEKLEDLLKAINREVFTPYKAHQIYERLHPFMDGNGRSGRVIWLWHMTHILGVDAMNPIYARGFLHTWYYQSLSDQDFLRIEELKERLEITHTYDSDGEKTPFEDGWPDGIAARDSLIKALEGGIAELLKEIEKLKK